MPLPTTKQQFADWILRRLGAPVINVEISNIQLEDCIDEAVQWFQNWHYDGSQRSYRVIKITEEMKNKNKRNHQNLTANRFDSDLWDDYRLGDRVLYNEGGAKWNIYLKTDSDAAITNFNTLWTREEIVLEADDKFDLTTQGQIGIKVPENVIAVTKVFRINSAISAGMWNYEYQYFLTNFDWFYGSGGGGSMAMTNYYTTRTYLELIDYMLNTQPAMRFNKHQNRLWIDISWEQKAKVDDYFLVEVYEAADPEVWGDVYSDMWLKRYATALAKKQWGSNLKKYSGTELPGGITLSGQELFDEAKEEINELEEQLKTTNLEMDSIIVG